MRAYLVCYDIVDDDMRLKVSKILGEYGERIQRSVFEIRVHSDTELEGLKTRLKNVLGKVPDLRFYSLCGRCRAESAALSGEKVATFPATIIF